MKLTVGIVISVVLCISLADAMKDFMPLDVPKPQIKKTDAKAAKKHDILPPIENGDTLTHADSSIEGLSDEEGEDYHENAMSRGRITSPKKSKAIGSENRDISENNNKETSNSKDEIMDEGVNIVDTEAQEKPDEVNDDEEEGEGGKYDDGVQDEANNIADIDENNEDNQVNTGNMSEQDEGWGKEVHEDD